MIRILLVDIHPALRQSVRRLLARDPEFVVVAETTQSDQAVLDFAHESPDVVVLGLHAKRLEAVRAVANGLPRARVVVFGSGDAPQYANVSRALGAASFVSAISAEHDLPAAIREAMTPVPSEQPSSGPVGNLPR